MASRTVVLLIDDLDNSEVADGQGRTVPFAFDGSSFEIDLSDEHKEEFARMMEPYIAAGRRVSGPARLSLAAGGRRPARSTANRAPATSDPMELANIRSWVRENGFPINDRGRIPGAVKDAYNKRDIERLTRVMASNGVERAEPVAANG